MASIFSQKDGLVIETYDKYKKAYNMNLVGGVIGQNVQATATYQLINGHYVPIRGYSYVHKYDTRFLKSSDRQFSRGPNFIEWLAGTKNKLICLKHI